MKQCPLCETDNDNTVLLCSCGYSFESTEISDSEKVRSWTNASGLQWHDKANRITRIDEIQRKKHGKKISTSQDVEGWSMRNTAKLLAKDASTISRHLKLGEAIKDYPSLLGCKTFVQASEHLDELQKGIAPKKDSFESEELLQRYLESNWENTVLAKDWQLVKRGKYDTLEIGEIDLLAYHKREPCYLVIELKKGKWSDKTIGQILLYMGWVKLRRAKENEEVKGLIISKPGDEKILYSMLCTTNIDLMSYDYIDNELKLTRVKAEEFLKYMTNSPYLVGPDGYFVRNKATGKVLVWDTAEGKTKALRKVTCSDTVYLLFPNSL